MNLRINVIGTGYLGATHAACLADLGFEVLGVDCDREKVARLADGEVPFSEPGPAELTARHVRSGRLRFTSSLREAAESADVHFICVGTPQRASGMAAEVSFVVAVVRGLAESLRRDCLIIGKSTITATIAWNPELLREGHAVQDTLTPDRLVFGVSTPEAELMLRRIYEQPIGAGTPVHVVDRATAELAKVAANAFLATKISFINAMAEMSDLTGADVTALADSLGDDSRIGPRFLDAGVGFGGGCLPKDVRALSARATELGVHSAARLLREVDTINVRARQRTVDLALSLCGSTMRRRRVAVLGAAFKPMSDDVRDSPALYVAGQLRLHGADVRVYDPGSEQQCPSGAPLL